MSKPAYQYDRTGYLIGLTQADESPLEPGVFLVPANCTIEPPPGEIPENKWPRWNGSAWTLVNKPEQQANANDPVEKLRAFLAENPDVAEIINNGGANV